MSNKQVLKKVMLSLFSVFMVITIAEVGVRVFVDAAVWRLSSPIDNWIPDDVIGWTNKKNLTVQRVVRNPERKIIRLQTNADGVFPVTAVRSKESNVFRIMIFGDSTVIGRSVDESERVNYHLKNFPVEVINAGVDAYSSDQVLLRMQKLVPSYKPDLVL